MSARKTYSIVTLSALCLIWRASVNSRTAGQQVPSQMREMAARAAAGSIKLNLQSDNATVPIGSRVALKISMLNADNQRASWERPCTVNLEITFPSKKVEKQKIEIPKAQSSAIATFVASEYGVATLRVTESTDSLAAARNTVFILSPGATPARAPARRLAPQGASFELDESPFPPQVRTRLVFASWIASSSRAKHFAQARQAGPTPIQNSATPPTVLPVAPPAAPQLLLLNSTGKSEILADGKDYARIRVYYMAPNEKGAPSDVRLWMTWSNGKFYPQPLIIHRGGFDAEGQFVSASPVQATISLVSSAPNVPVQDSSTLTISFGPPIYGFGPETSQTTLQMSLIDREPLVGYFFDEQGRCTQTDHL
jgi:hypothetical protein